MKLYEHLSLDDFVWLYYKSGKGINFAYATEDQYIYVSHMLGKRTYINDRMDYRKDVDFICNFTGGVPSPITFEDTKRIIDEFIQVFKYENYKNYGTTETV